MHTSSRFQNSLIFHASDNSPFAGAMCEDYGSSSDNFLPTAKPAIVLRSASTPRHKAQSLPDAPFKDDVDAGHCKVGHAGDVIVQNSGCPAPVSSFNELQSLEALLHTTAPFSSRDGHNARALSSLQDDGSAQSSCAETLNFNVAVERSGAAMPQHAPPSTREGNGSGTQLPSADVSARSSEAVLDGGPSACDLFPRQPLAALPPASSTNLQSAGKPLFNLVPCGSNQLPMEASEALHLLPPSCSSTSNQPWFHSSDATAAAATATAAGTSGVFHLGLRQHPNLQPTPTLRSFVPWFRPPPVGGVAQKPHYPATTGEDLSTPFAAAVAAFTAPSPSPSPFIRPFIRPLTHEVRMEHVAAAGGRTTCLGSLASTAAAAAHASGYFTGPIGRHPRKSPPSLRQGRGAGACVGTADPAFVAAFHRILVPYRVLTAMSCVRDTNGGVRWPLQLRPESPFDWGLQLPEREESPMEWWPLSAAHLEEHVTSMNRAAWRPAPSRTVSTPAAKLGRWLAGGPAAATSADLSPRGAFATIAAAGYGPGLVAAKLASAAAPAPAGHAVVAAAANDRVIRQPLPHARALLPSMETGLAAAGGQSTGAHACDSGAAATAVVAAAAVAEATADATQLPGAGSGIRISDPLLTQQLPVAALSPPTSSGQQRQQQVKTLMASEELPFNAAARGSDAAATATSPLACTAGISTLRPMEPAATAAAGSGGGEEAGMQSRINSSPSIPYQKPATTTAQVCTEAGTAGPPTACTAADERTRWDDAPGSPVGKLLATVARLAAEGGSGKVGSGASAAYAAAVIAAGADADASAAPADAEGLGNVGCCKTLQDGEFQGGLGSQVCSPYDSCDGGAAATAAAAAAAVNGGVGVICFPSALKRRLEDMCADTKGSSGVPHPILRRELLLNAMEEQLQLKPLPLPPLPAPPAAAAPAGAASVTPQ